MVDVNAALAVAVNLTVLIAAVSAGVVWLRKWLRQQVAEPAQAAARSLKANGGESAFDYAKSAAESGQAVVERLDELSATAAENQRIATEALTVAKETSHRLDRHLLEDHRERK